jgi:hypothetical protein
MWENVLLCCSFSSYSFSNLHHPLIIPAIPVPESLPKQHKKLTFVTHPFINSRGANRTTTSFCQSPKMVKMVKGIVKKMRIFQDEL